MSAHFYQQRIPGLFCTALLAAASYGLMTLPWLSHLGISPMVIAIVLGITLGNTLPLSAKFTPGIQFAAKQLLRTAIVLYGFRVSLQEIAAVGLPALLIDISVVVLTLFIGYQVGKRLFKLDSDLALLISAGAAICGAAAVLAVEDVIKSEPYKATVAIGTVVLFGTLSMFLYPVLQRANLLGLTDTQFGVFAGASVHEVAQALVTGSNISPAVGETAVVVKMIRVLLLVPVLFVLSAWKSSASTNNKHHKNKIMIPWFAIGFLLVILFNSLHLLPTKLVAAITQADIILLTMAMGAIGIETKLSKIRKVGLNPLYLAVLLFIWLLSFSVFAVKWY